MKRSLLTFLALSSMVFASSDTYIDIDTKIGNKLFQNELAYKEYLKKEAMQNLKINQNRKIAGRNACEIQKIKRVLIKLIQENRNYSPIILKTVKTEGAEKVLGIKKNNLNQKEECVEKKIKVIDTSHINESYFKYKKLKSFKVTYNLAGEFSYPVLSSSVSNMLHLGDTFKADMYTKAGWVHNVNGGWVKGYKLFPRVNNLTTKKDIEKWSVKYKIITNCEKGGK